MADRLVRTGDICPDTREVLTDLNDPEKESDQTVDMNVGNGRFPFAAEYV